MKLPLTLAVAVVLCAVAPTLRGEEVHRDEILRLGDLVQHVDGQVRDGLTPIDAVVQVMGLPEDDSDKFFLSVIRRRNCPTSERLIEDWRRSPALLALGIPGDPRRSWSHVNVYYDDDASQAFRWEKMRVEGYPTVFVQPPRSGKYGPPSTLVYKAVYTGDAERLASEAAAAIRAYVARFAQQVAQQIAQQTQPEQRGQILPPWRPAPREEPFTPLTEPGPIPPLQTHVNVDVPWRSILGLLTAFSIPGLIALVIAILVLTRSYRQSKGLPLLLDDAAFQRLVDSLRQLAAEEQAERHAEAEEPLVAAAATPKRAARRKR